MTPSRSREQPWLSLVVSTTHIPDAQRGVLTVRVCVPVSSQVPSV